MEEVSVTAWMIESVIILLGLGVLFLLLAIAGLLDQDQA
jgi:hypothetical protein